MLIKLYWGNCTIARLESEPIDTFWVEATQQEAESLIYPHCSAETVVKSQFYGISDREIATKIGNSARSYCFLIAQDLSTIRAFPVYYPHSPMWEAHSPFKEIASQEINCLSELKDVVISEIVNFPVENNLSLLV